MKRPDNPYRILVEEHEKILDDEQDLFKNKAWKWSEYFWNTKPIFLEIWTWMWNFFSKEASRNLDKNFIWIELKYKRLYNSAEKSIALWVKDFIMLKTFGQNIDKIFAAVEIDKTYVFFPDPWGKKDRQKNTEYRWIDKDERYSTAGEVVIFDDKVIGILSQPEESVAFEIQGQTFADFLKIVFEMAWDKAGEKKEWNKIDTNKKPLG